MVFTSFMFFFKKSLIVCEVSKNTFLIVNLGFSEIFFILLLYVSKPSKKHFIFKKIILEINKII